MSELLIELCSPQVRIPGFLKVHFSGFLQDSGFLQQAEALVAISQVVLRDEFPRSKTARFYIASLRLFELFKLVVSRSQVIERQSVIGRQFDYFFPCLGSTLPVTRFEQGVTQPLVPTRFYLGNCEYQLGKSKEAVAEWDKAIEDSSEQRGKPLVEALFNLGVGLWKTADLTGEDRKKAANVWRRALDLDRNLTVVEDNLEAIEHQREPKLEILDFIRVM